MAALDGRRNALLFLFGIAGLCIGKGGAKLCPVYANTKELNEADVSLNSGNQKPEESACPRPSDPNNYSECCVKSTCCPPERHFYEIDNRIATAIAVSVTLTCVAITAVIIICCFWSKCPLYNACRVQYSLQDEIPLGKVNESQNMRIMPSDEPSKKNSFSCRKPSINENNASAV